MIFSVFLLVLVFVSPIFILEVPFASSCNLAFFMSSIF